MSHAITHVPSNAHASPGRLRRLGRWLAALPDRRIAVGLLFWGWNTLALAFALFGVLPRLAATAISPIGPSAAQIGVSLGLAAVVLLSVALALTRLRGQPRRILRLFYGFEAPLVALATVRLLAFDQVTAGGAFVMATAAVGPIGLLWDLLRAGRDPAASRVALHGLGALTALYACALAAFYAIPGITRWLGHLIGGEWIAGLTRTLLGGDVLAPFAVALGLLLAAATATVWIGLLPAHAALAIGAWRRAARAAGLPVAAGLTLAVAGGWLAGFAMTAAPAVEPTLATAETPADADREALRSDLLAIYLAGHRTLGQRGDHGLVAWWWADAFGGDGAAAQRLHDALAAPFLYGGAHPESERDRAAAAFAALFDAPIERAAQWTILDATRAQLDRRGERPADLLARDVRRVRLVEQHVAITPREGWAEVELREVLANRTRDRQEVRYHFTLPPDAVPTGLWLGDDRDPRAFAPAIAPRGAASAVYRAEVAQRRDPALLEEVGPGHYRLRVFPIEPTYGGPGDEGPRMHVTLTYAALPRDGRWPLPRLRERRNVFWDDDSIRTLDGSPFAGDDWMPPEPSAPGDMAAPDAIAVDGFTITRAATPAAGPPKRPVVVIVDRSHSMGAHRAALEAALAEVAAWPDATVVLTAAPIGGRAPSEAAGAVDLVAHPAIGALTVGEMLRQAAPWTPAGAAVLVLTDDGEPVPSGDALPTLSGPLWLVHLGGTPDAWDDAVLAALDDTGGGIADGLDGARRGLALAAGATLRGGEAWTVRETPGAAPRGPAAIGARWVVEHLLRTPGVGLDAVHAIAVRHGIVTRASSLLVLVDDAQRQRLAEAEAGEARFARPGAEPTAPVPFAVTGVPEPEEWALLFVVAVILLRQARRGRGLAAGRRCAGA